MKTTKQKQIDIWQVVNINKETNEIQMLDYLFDHGDGFKGATGTRFDPISKAAYREAMSKDSIIDRIIDCGLVTAPNESLQYKFAEVIYKEMKANGELESFVFDLSYTEHWDKLRKHGYPKSKYPIFNCTGGGRMFDADFQGNVNPELSAKIREYEVVKKSKKVA